MSNPARPDPGRYPPPAVPDVSALIPVPGPVIAPVRRGPDQHVIPHAAACRMAGVTPYEAARLIERGEWMPCAVRVTVGGLRRRVYRPGDIMAWLATREGDPDRVAAVVQTP